MIKFVRTPWLFAVVIRCPLPNGVAGWSAVPFLILIRPSAWGRVDVLRHEMEHQRQLWRYLVVGFWIGYLFSRRFRLRVEAHGEAWDVLYAMGFYSGTSASTLARLNTERRWPNVGKALQDDIVIWTLQRLSEIR